MPAYVNYPLTASDDDEFFDAPPGSLLILCNADGIETRRYTRVDTDYDWQAPGGTVLQAGVLWGSLFADGNPFGEHDIRPGSVLRVTLEWANHYDMCEGGREAAEARAEARVAAWMAAGTA
jgi:hypothetical protein